MMVPFMEHLLGKIYKANVDNACVMAIQMGSVQMQKHPSYKTLRGLGEVIHWI